MGVKTYDISSLDKYLDYFRKRPLMFIAREEIDLLAAHISGYNIGNFQNSTILNDFHDYVLNYYSHSPNTEGWRRAILRETNNDQKKAFIEFFRLYDEFKTQNEKTANTK